MSNPPPHRIGLALGSGSARGWAHIGVIRGLREAGIEPDIVCGTSIGALVGAADPGSMWLFVTVETCSISIRLDSDDPAAIVATALFGDGAAAAIVTSGTH